MDVLWYALFLFVPAQQYSTALAQVHTEEGMQRPMKEKSKPMQWSSRVESQTGHVFRGVPWVKSARDSHMLPLYTVTRRSHRDRGGVSDPTSRLRGSALADDLNFRDLQQHSRKPQLTVRHRTVL